jgi:hypothetical protein
MSTLKKTNNRRINQDSIRRLTDFAAQGLCPAHQATPRGGISLPCCSHPHTHRFSKEMNTLSCAQSRHVPDSVQKPPAVGKEKKDQ